MLDGPKVNSSSETTWVQGSSMWPGREYDVKSVPKGDNSTSSTGNAVFRVPRYIRGFLGEFPEAVSYGPNSAYSEPVIGPKILAGWRVLAGNEALLEEDLSGWSPEELLIDTDLLEEQNTDLVVDPVYIIGLRAEAGDHNISKCTCTCSYINDYGKPSTSDVATSYNCGNIVEWDTIDKYYDSVNKKMMYFQEWRGDTHPAHWDTPNEYRVDKYNNVLHFKLGHESRTLTAVYDTEIKTFDVYVSSNEESGTHTLTRGDRMTVSNSSSDFKGWYITYYGDMLPEYNKSTTVYVTAGTMTPRSIEAVYTPVNIQCTNCTHNGSYNSQADVFEECEIKANVTLNENQRIDDWEVTGPAEVIGVSEDLSAIRIKTDYDGSGNTTPIKIEPIINTYSGFTVSLYKAIDGTDESDLYDTFTTTSYESAFYAPVAPENTVFLGWYIDTETLGVVTNTEKATSAKIGCGHMGTFKVDRNISITAVYSEMPDILEERHSLTITGWVDEYDEYFLNWFYYYGSRNTESNNTFGMYEEGTEIKLMFGTGYYPPIGFIEWTGDTEYITGSNGTDHHSITITMPNKDIHLHAVLAPSGSPYDFPREVRVLGGLAWYWDGGEKNIDSTQYVRSGTNIYVCASETSVPNFVYDHMIVNHRYPDGNVISERMPFNGRDNISVTNMIWDSPDVPAHDIEVYLYRRHVLEFTVYTTNATGPGTVYAGTYPIAGALIDTENERYQFNGWTCHDIDGTDQSTCIEDLNELVTTITLSDRSLYAIANYTTYYKLTVINGQDSGTGYYPVNTVVNTVTANDPVDDTQIFDHWDDPVGVVEDIYDSTPTIVMKDSIATITAVFISIADITDNSIMSTNEQLTTGTMFRESFNTISGIAAIGTLVFDEDGSVGVITNMNEDQLDDTKDYTVEKLFYGDDVEWLTM